ncbi:MAG: nickel-dependent lactate racemase [Chloroflexi bacterium]|nr:MAG: nickel-dependent lactate racemase [Chloroflexota bacterium]
MEFELPYAKARRRIYIPDGHHVDVIAPKHIKAATKPLSVVEHALDNPVGHQALQEFRGAKSAAIAVNDKTRPVPHEYLLPPLLTRLEVLGIAPEHITLIIATGTHPVMPPEEYAWILPQSIIERYPIMCHDCLAQDDLVFLGETRRQTPVWMNRHYMNVDVRLVVGNIEPHQFMGFSGGVKSAAIGLAGKATINRNHAMMMDDNARLGHYDNNPARQDVEDIGKMIGVHFAVNAILNNDKQIVDVIAGEPTAVMQAGIPRVQQLNQVPVDALYDVMIVSPGGHPKDINLYQAQKGLAHAALITKPGGTILLLAACGEGTGSESYEHWMAQGARSYDEIFRRFHEEEFQVGPHKAFQIARDAAQVKVLLYSDMQPDFVERLLLTPVADVQDAVDAVLSMLPDAARIGVMPVANATVPILS